jgi:glycine/D-amino acid oxidase-like deaminating enzyme
VQRVLSGAKRAADAEFPVFMPGRVDRTWGGFIDVTPDALPAIGPLRAVPGLVLASGFSGHGFGLGPGGGRMAADIAMGYTPPVDPAPFAPERFGM